MRQPVANIRKPQPAPEYSGNFKLPEPAPAITNLQDQAAVFAMRLNREFHRTVSRFHSMAQRIFQQRLQNKLRHERLVQGWVNRIGHAQFILEAFLHQVEIQPRDFQFFREGNLMRARGLEREAQEVAQLRDHRVRGSNVFVHDGRNRVQRVEEEVRLQLQTQIFQLRLSQLCPEFGGGKLLGLRDPQTFKIIVNGHEDGVADQIIRKLHRVAIQHNSVVIRSLSDKRKEKVAAKGH